MRMCTLARSSSFIFLASLAIAFSCQSSVYANIMEPNQCAKLFEVQKQIPTFKELMKQKIRDAQEAQSQSATELIAEEVKRKEEEERQKSEALDQANLGFKIHFLEIPPNKFVMGEGEQAKEVEITKPYEIMDKRMTQLMYARLMELMGFNEIKDIFPSIYTDGESSEIYNFKGQMISIRPDDPVTNVSWNDIKYTFIPQLNKLSRSKDPNIQSVLKKIIPDHQKGDRYDFVTKTQLVNVMMLAKTEDGDSIDEMIKRGDLEKLNKYVLSRSNWNFNRGTIREASLLPLYFGGKPIYLHGNVWELTKDHSDRSASITGGKDPLRVRGKGRSVLGGAWNSYYEDLRSSMRLSVDPGWSYQDLGFRLARVSRSGIHNSLGGMP